MAKRWWVCRGCGNRNERLKRKCIICQRSRPKARVPAHAQTLRDDSYEAYCRINEQIHDVWDESCAVCGKPKEEERRHDRDHGHLQGDLSYGKPRGLACVADNILMPRKLNLEKAREIMAYLERVEKYYAKNSANGQ